MVSPSVMWPAEHENALRELVLAGAGSHSIMAGMLNERFRTAYSRNAVIGKVSRMGMHLTWAPHPVKKKASKSPARRRRPAPTAKMIPIEVDLSVFRCVEVEPKNVALVDLSSDGCRWPYGDGPFVFCDHPKLGSAPYCGSHLILSRGPGTSSEQAANRLPREAR